MNDRHQINRDQLARDIFLRAVELESIQTRVAYLDGACQRDAALRSRVEALLESHRQDSFLETPAIEGPPAGISETALSEGPGTVIGRYKLLQKIGEGGFGAVYMAEQKEPVKRRVALKIIKLGMDTRHVVARFEAERQALAMMDHQNIARVLDAGATDTGRPYFVMELVRGVPITEYCDQNRLLAVQPAFQAAILVSGGYAPKELTPAQEVHNAFHFAPHMRLPVLLITGAYDTLYPYQSVQSQFFEDLASPTKQHVLLESGHNPPNDDVSMAADDWLRKLFGPP